VLCGVGGRTVAEAQANISYEEYLDWCKFRAKYGSLHFGMRVDRAAARGIAYYLSANSKKSFQMADFSPYDKALVDEKEGSIDEAFDLFRSVAKHGQ